MEAEANRTFPCVHRELPQTGPWRMENVWQMYTGKLEIKYFGNRLRALDLTDVYN